MVTVTRNSANFRWWNDGTTSMNKILSIRSKTKVLGILCIMLMVVTTFTHTFLYHKMNRRPVMNTFYHLRSPEEDKVMELWKREWSNAGFDTRILTLKDAKRHPAFKKVERIMEPIYGGRSHEALCFYRWFAMAALGGGWMSEIDTYPTNFPINEGIDLPNGGTFTSFQGHAPALMSGTGLEWNRVANLLIDAIKKIPGDIKTDMSAFEVLRHEQSNGIVFEYPPLNVHRGFAYDAPRKVNCENMAKVRAVHISHARTQNAINEGLYPIVNSNDKGTEFLYRADAYNIFLTDWKNQCGKLTKDEHAVEVVTKRPIMHTFYYTIDSMGKTEDAVLELWKEEWRNAGFDTKILNLEDAMKHPDFDEVEKIMIPLHGKRDYNAICFYRWLAMAASGGGWMSDHDTYPTNFPMHEGIDLPNNGVFTSFQAHIPALMSGTATEWDRVSKLLIDAIPRVAEDVLKSDMHAFNVLRMENSAGVIFMTPYVNYVQEGFIYHSPRIVDCEKMSITRAVHISHALSHQAVVDGLYPLEIGEDDPVGKDHRAEASKVFLDDWRSQCGEGTNTKAKKAGKEAMRPVMHTFYRTISPFDDKVLELWRVKWADAGFEPKVLTLKDAMRHPQFNRVETEMIHLLVSRGQDPLPFYQWMAMAVSGGGWMSTYYTFPINFAPEDVIEFSNDVIFISFQDTMPSLMFGSSDEWERVFKLLIDVIPRIEGTTKSVALAFQVLKQDGNSNIVFKAPSLDVQEGFVYEAPRKVNCNKMSLGKVVEITPQTVHRAVADGLYPIDVGEDDPNGDHSHAEASKLFLDDWVNQCSSTLQA